MRLAYAAVALCAAVVLTTGCGSSDVISLETVANAATKTETVGTARFRFEGEMRFNHDHAQRVEFTGHGVADWRDGSAGAEMTAVYKFPNAIQEAIKQQLGGPLSADFVFDESEGVVLYVRFPFLKGQLPGGKTWMKADLVEIGKRYGLDVDRLKETKQSDPGNMLAYLKSAVSVEKVGSDLVRNEVTTHYAAEVDAETIVEQSPPDQQKAMRKYLRLMGIDTYPVDLWVDRNGVVRKLATKLEYKLPSGEYVQMSVSEVYFDFGVEVDIEPPAAKTVLDVTPRRKPQSEKPRRLTS
jgi:hypothetical protein